MRKINTTTLAGIVLIGSLGAGNIVQASEIASLINPNINIEQRQLVDQTSTVDLDISGLGNNIVSLELSIAFSNIKDVAAITSNIPGCYMTYTQNERADGQTVITYYIVSEHKNAPLDFEGKSEISFTLQGIERLKAEDCQLKVIEVGYEVSTYTDVKADIILIAADGSQVPSVPEEDKPGDTPSTPEEDKPGDTPSTPEGDKPGDVPSTPEGDKPGEVPSTPEGDKPNEVPSTPGINRPSKPSSGSSSGVSVQQSSIYSSFLYCEIMTLRLKILGAFYSKRRLHV